jgi:ribosomal protein S18 acetylase RimI-like enzyme
MTGLRPAPEGGLGEIRTLEPGRYAEAGDVLARAFLDDPLWAWLVPDTDVRRRRLPWLFERALADLRVATIEAAGEPLLGVATWIPPTTDVPAPPAWTVVGALVRLRGGFGRLVRYGREAARLEQEVGAAASWRLGGIGVAPAAQGRGLGSALVRSGLERADADGRPVVLLTSNPVNLGFYERHGFEVAAERRLPAAGPPGWAMVRPARPAAP